MFGYNYRYFLTNPLDLIKFPYKEVKWFIQRGRRGYSDRDVWSLDGYMLSWLPSALKQLRNTKHGHPVDMTEKQWDKALNEMIAGLTMAMHIMNMDFPYRNKREAQKRMRLADRGWDLFRKHVNNLWD